MKIKDLIRELSEFDENLDINLQLKRLYLVFVKKVKKL